LLRRYGHVDLLPLPQGDIGNPGDVIEIRADLVANAVLEHQSTLSSELQERIDWWLEEGGDDVIVIESDCEIPPILVSLVRLFLLPRSEWEKTKSKSKPPRANLDADVVNILMTTLHQRLMQYRTSLEVCFLHTSPDLVDCSHSTGGPGVDATSQLSQ
jgi:SET domain-containing protein 6